MSTTTDITLRIGAAAVQPPRPPEVSAADAQDAFPLSLEQHRLHAQRLAARHVVGRFARDRLRGRLRVAEKSLRESRRRLLQAGRTHGKVSPAAFTFLEMFSFVEEHLSLAREELARPYRLPLPPVVAGAAAGLPRIYDLARELIVHSDGQLDAELAQEVVASYQSRAGLMLRELNALPAMLRLALLEHLSRVAAALDQEPRQPLGGSAAAGVLQTVSLGNGINALRNLGAIDWREFVERQSAVETILRRDPLGIYPHMSPKSREHYRKAIEAFARRSPLDESQVATAVVELAAVGHGGHDTLPRAAANRRGTLVGEGMKERHVGYFLVDRGRRALEERIGYRPGRRERAARAAAAAPLACYVGAIAATWLAVVAAAVILGLNAGIASFAGAAGSVVLALLFAGAASEGALRIVNCLSTMLVEPRPVMRLDFSAGIPEDCRTLVAVPTMLGSREAVRDLAASLEVRYLANQDDNLCFALVTDFPDAATETLPADAEILEVARGEIDRLNARYGEGGSGPFYLLHRPRQWNSQEQKWMGRERKRGKLGALNRLLRGDAADFSVTVGALDALPLVRYVITLDTDTQLPPGTARELVSCMAHPLNRPRIDKASRIVVEGHAILQPRVATTMSEARRSVFAQLFSGDAGVDPYTHQTSDVYQDVFGEGSYIGKGIYDVDAVETVFLDRFPENRVLSHDLIEGCFARSGLIDDVELFEGFPARLAADMSRRHRWIRGDWQIAAWLWPRVPTADGNAANPLSPLARWKIFDNLRRSLAPVMLLGFVLAAWFLAPALAGSCLLWAIVASLAPDLLALLPGCCGKPAEKPWELHFRNRAADLRKLLAREAIGWAMLPYTVSSDLDAIVRALYRVHVSHRKLLEWTVSSDAERNCVRDRRGYYRLLWACPLAAIASGGWLACAWPAALLAVGPLVLAWAVAPSIAWRISRARSLDAVRLSGGERRHFRRWARQTWHFFDTFVNEQSHWLPPDNVQFDDPWIVAPRTSPTNIGLGLLADLAACDLGHLSISRLLERTGRTFQTMLRLETHRGHLYNWYDTRTLEPVGARYVSTVDSGNLRGALLVMQAGLAELRDRPLVGPHFAQGFQDAIEVIARLAATNEAAGLTLGAAPRGARQAMHVVDRAATIADELESAADATRADVKEWTAALRRQCDAARAELLQLAFWLGADRGEQLNSALAAFASCQAVADLLAAIERADRDCSLRRLPEMAEDIARHAASAAEAVGERSSPLNDELAAVVRRAAHAAAAAREQLAEIDALIERCHEFSVMDYRFLYHPARKLLAVGYDVSEHRLDPCCYDLLASEARLASFLAVSDGQLPLDHWAALGRGVALHGGAPTLLSWSGSMFEYLMPMLVMPSYPTTLLDASCRAAVRWQIAHARERGRAWGVSESCYDRRNPDGAYSYRAFGVPGLRLERRTDETAAIAPYASALAAMVAPRAACENLSRLEESGAACRYGFYDAVDHTVAGQAPAACRTVMAHHSGMALVALANALLDAPMRRRLMVDPCRRAYDLLLQQRMPQTVRPVDWRRREIDARLMAGLEPPAPTVRAIDAPHAAADQFHVLGADDYQLKLPAVGSAKRCCYFRDVSTGRFWSSTYEPARRQGDKHRAVFAPGRAEFRVVCKPIDVRTLVAASPEQELEVHRIKIGNLSRDEREIELTTYIEIGRVARIESLAGGGLLAWWPPRAAGEPSDWMFHFIRAVDADLALAGFESSRERFIGAGRTLAAPAAMEESGELSSAPGVSNDAILCLRYVFMLAAEKSVEIDLVTGAASARDRALAAIHRHRDPRLTWRVFEMAEAAARAVALSEQCAVS